MPKVLPNLARNLRRRLRSRVEPPITIKGVEYSYGWDAMGDKAVFVEVQLDPTEEISFEELNVMKVQVRDIFERAKVRDWVYVDFVDVEEE